MSYVAPHRIRAFAMGILPPLDSIIPEFPFFVAYIIESSQDFPPQVDTDTKGEA